MHPRESHRLRPGTTVWVWVVQLARGRWWPGTVEALRTVEGHLRVVVRFECRPTSGDGKVPVTAGITTTAMRYVELRNINSDGMDHPAHTPVSLLECPEEPANSEDVSAALSGTGFAPSATRTNADVGGD